MKPLSFLLILSTLLLTSCMSYDLSRRITQQGNLLPASKIAQLKVGMSKSDVAHLMGTSLVYATFNPERVDYAYTWQKGTQTMEVRYATLTFKQDRVVKIEHRP